MTSLKENFHEQRVEKRDQLYEKIEAEIHAILNFKKIAGNSDIVSREEFFQSLDDQRDDIRKKFDPSVLEKYERFLKLEEQYDLSMRVHTEKTERMYLDPDENSDVEELDAEIIEQLTQEIDVLEEDLEDLQTEMFELSMDDNIVFLTKIDSFVEDMKAKKVLASTISQEFQENPTTVRRWLHGYKPKDSVDAKVTNVSVNFIVSSSDFEEMHGTGADGFHIVSNPINIIKEGEGAESVIQHEENHNLSESFVSSTHYTDNLSADLEKTFGRISEGKKYDHMIMKQFVERDKRKIRRTIANYHQMNFQEIIADVDRLPSGEMNTFLVNYAETETALKRFVKKYRNDDEEFFETVLSDIKKMEENFVKYFYSLSNIFYVAKQIGKIEEAKALVILFGDSSNIRKVERHLRHYDQHYDDHVTIRRFTGEFDYMKKLRKDNSIVKIFKNIFDIGEKRNKVSDEYGIAFDDLNGLKKVEECVAVTSSEDQKKAILKKIQNFAIEEDINQHVFNLNKSDAEYYIMCAETIEKIAQMCGDGQNENIFHFRESIILARINNVLEASDADGLEQLYHDEKLIAHFPKEKINDWIADTISVEWDEYCDENGMIKDEKMRKILHEIGVGDTFDRLFDENSEEFDENAFLKKLGL